MQSVFNNFQDLFNNHFFNFQNQYIDKIFWKFKVFIINNQNYLYQNIKGIVNTSKIIIIDTFSELSESYYFICFESTLIIILQSDISIIQFLFKNDDSIISLSDQLKYLSFDQINKIITFKSQTILEKQLSEKLAENFHIKYDRLDQSIEINKIWNKLRLVISNFLIKRSLSKCENLNRIEEFKKKISTENDEKIFKDNQFITLETSFLKPKIQFLYHLEFEGIFIRKIFYNDIENKLFQRERENYLNIFHPLIPCYYGIYENRNTKSLIIEYIHGLSLEQITQLNLSFEDKLRIIFKIMLIIEYLHEKNFIYRDLKPSNFIVDKYKSLILIDFDRMIKNGQRNDNNSTKDFAHNYVSPEILYDTINEFTFENDIYSLGLLIYFIITEKNVYLDLNNLNQSLKILYSEISDNFIKNIFKQCTEISLDKRPKISDLIDTFYFHYIINISLQINNIIFNIFKYNLVLPYWMYIDDYKNSDIHKFFNISYNEKDNIDEITKKKIHYCSIAVTHNHSIALYILGKIYYKNKYVDRNIHKAIYYLSLSLKQNNSKAEYLIGKIFIEGKLIKKDIRVGIKYIEKSASRNNKKAQYYLGMLYYAGHFLKKDINKAIFLLTLSADQNYVISQHALGVLYFLDMDIPRDINNSIHYLTLAANNNCSSSQKILGDIFCNVVFVPLNINKAIHYYTLAANNNNINAQKQLAKMYFEDIYVQRDINKAIHYFTMAANQNDPESQNILGQIYYDNKFVQRDINKAIHYFLLSSNLNYQYSHFLLGLIYYENKFVPRELNKAIHYFKMAADNNNVYALNILGFIHSNIDIEKAIHYFTLSSNQNNADAQYCLGLIFYENKYYRQDIKKAIYFFTLAANNNHVNAQYKLGMIYFENIYVQRDLKKSFHYIEQAARQNHKYALAALGLFYYEGEYIKRNMQKALEYLKIIEKDNLPIINCLQGLIYYYGDKNIPKDIKRSLYYLKLAADNNEPNAQYYLGYIYINDKPIENNIEKGIYYLSLASDQGISDASSILGYIYYDKKYDHFNITKAIHYFELASLKNNPLAQLLLFIIYINNIYVQQNIPKSIEYLTLSAKQDFSLSQEILGFLYYTGKYVRKDVNKGIDLLIKASKNEAILSYFLLGYIYHKGKYVKRNIHESIHYYKEASNIYDQYSKNNLGVIYKNGFLDQIKPNIAIAIEYFNESIKQKNDVLSMYNLASIYIFKFTDEEKLNISIDLLIRCISLYHSFDPSYHLLCIALIKKFDSKMDKISEYLNNCFHDFSIKIIHIIKNEKLLIKSNFDKKYEICKSIDFLYNFHKRIIESKKIMALKTKSKSAINAYNSDVNDEFYEGFGKDIELL